MFLRLVYLSLQDYACYNPERRDLNNYSSSENLKTDAISWFTNFIMRQRGVCLYLCSGHIRRVTWVHVPSSLRSLKTGTNFLTTQTYEPQFLGTTFNGLTLPLCFFTLNPFVPWPVVFSIRFSCKIVYITWRELRQNCSKKLRNFRGEVRVGRHTLEWSGGSLTFTEEDYSLSASAVCDSMLNIMAVAVHNWL